MKKKLKLTLQRDDKSEFRTAAIDCQYRLINGRGEEIFRFCPLIFHGATGFSLKPGQKKRVEITVKAVK